MVDESADHCGGDGVVAEDLTPASEGLVARDDHGRVFVAAEMNCKIRFAASGSKGMYPISSTTISGIRLSRVSSSARRPLA